jgi:hypothetical protein
MKRESLGKTFYLLFAIAALFVVFGLTFFASSIGFVSNIAMEVITIDKKK